PARGSTNRGNEMKSVFDVVMGAKDERLMYALVCRNGYPLWGAHGLDHMIERLEAAAERFRALRAAGVTDALYADGETTFYTRDPAVAEKFGFEALGPCTREELVDDDDDPEHEGEAVDEADDEVGSDEDDPIEAAQRRMTC